MRLLLTGASGMIGGELALRFASTHDVVCGVHRSDPPAGFATAPFDLLEPSSLARLVEETRPDAVVHCAALANADTCESDPDGAWRANVDSVAALARRCRVAGLPLVAFSTDLVLPGDRAFLRETDGVAPVLVYGRTKLEGERVLLAEHPGAVAARVALVTGRGYRRPTASEAIAWALRAQRPLRLLVDQYRTPVDVHDVGDAVLRAIERGARGILHLGGPERLSRLDLGRRVAAVLGLDAAAIAPIRQGDLPGAPRPADVSLDVTRARAELGWEPAPLDDSIRRGRRVED